MQIVLINKWTCPVILHCFLWRNDIAQLNCFRSFCQYGWWSSISLYITKKEKVELAFLSLNVAYVNVNQCLSTEYRFIWLIFYSFINFKTKTRKQTISINLYKFVWIGQTFRKNKIYLFVVRKKILKAVFFRCKNLKRIFFFCPLNEIIFNFEYKV